MNNKTEASLYDYIAFAKHNCPECKVCPLSSSNNNTEFSCKIFMEKYPDRANKIILDWVKDHPCKTRQTEFLNLFPEAALDSKGCIKLGPCDISENYECPPTPDCAECRQHFWSTPIY